MQKKKNSAWMVRYGLTEKVTYNVIPECLRGAVRRCREELSRRREMQVQRLGFNEGRQDLIKEDI